MTAGRVRITLDGEAIGCAAGLPLTEVLVTRAPGWRTSPRLGAPRGMYCGMGLCCECAVTVDGRWSRACLERTHDGMVVETGRVPETSQ